MTPRRTVCRWCATALTPRQITRRRTYCSRACGKEQYHAQHPGKAREWLAKGHATNRRKFLARLKAQVAGLSPLEAYRRGYRTGFSVGANKRRARERTAA